MIVQVSGQVVGFKSKPYDFTDESGSRQVGTSRELWVSTDVSAPPRRLRVRRENEAAVLAHDSICRQVGEVGHPIELMAEITADGSLYLDSLLG